MFTEAVITALQACHARHVGIFQLCLANFFLISSVLTPYSSEQTSFSYQLLPYYFSSTMKSPSHITKFTNGMLMRNNNLLKGNLLTDGERGKILSPKIFSLWIATYSR